LVIEVRSVDAQEPTHRVLLLYPYDDVSPATLIAGNAIRKLLAEFSPFKIDIRSDFLDLGRLPAEAEQIRLARYLAENPGTCPRSSCPWVRMRSGL
jgi:hypothetical protein